MIYLNSALTRDTAENCEGDIIVKQMYDLRASNSYFLKDLAAPSFSSQTTGRADFSLGNETK